MLRSLVERLDRSSSSQHINMKARQMPLYERYKTTPNDAVVVDTASTTSVDNDIRNPLQSAVTICHKNPVKVPVGVHTAVGGESDNPTPGDILCGAIAACLDSTLRIISNRLNIQFKHLSVEVSGTVDVRGTLRVDHNTPVAFQHFEVSVLMKPTGWIPGNVLDKILRAAEYSCIVIQTVKHGATVSVHRLR